MSSRVRDLLACAAIAVAAGCQGRAASAPRPQPPAGEVWVTSDQIRDARVQVEPVAARTVSNQIATTGKVTFDDLRVSHVFSPVTGRVVRILADPGQRVDKSAALALIQSPDVGNALADLAKAESDLAAARHNLARQQDLYGSRAVSQKELEIAQDTFRKSRAELERARRKAALLRGHAGVDATNGVGDVTQSFTLRAPIAGEIIARNVNPGAEVQGQYGGGAAVELFTVGELDSVWVLADVFEMDLARVTRGAPVTITVVAYPERTFAGQVDYISGTLDPATRTARVRCSVPNPTRALKPEMYASVGIGVEGKRVPALPRSALLRVSDQTVVFVQDGGAPDGRIRFLRRVVAVDESEGGAFLPIVRGVAPGERVVTTGGILLLGML